MRRTLLRDRKPLKYSLFVATDEQKETDSEGLLLDTGEPIFRYSEPIDFKANLTTSGSSESQMYEYGIDRSEYDAVMITPKNCLPIVEGSLIWEESEPQRDIEGYIKKASADYIVKAKKPTTNVDRYILKRLVH